MVVAVDVHLCGDTDTAHQHSTTQQDVVTPTQLY
jgi:hypothetical protein